MRQYELTVLIHPDLEMNPQPALDKIAKIIESVGGKITKEVNEGKKRLASRVKKQDFAVYYYYELDLPVGKTIAKKVIDSLDIQDELLRHLLVVVDENRLKIEAKKKAQKSEEEGEAEAESKEEE